jgi:hypothetical protein
MLSENRQYHFVGELTLSRSRHLDKQSQPKDDKINWLFLNTGGHQFSFVYKIEKPSEAKYGKPFSAHLAFTMIEAVKDIIQSNQTYEILRGQETIGSVRIVSVLGK